MILREHHRTGFLGIFLRHWAAGEILAQFGAEEEGVKVLDIDLERTQYLQRGWPFLRDRRIDAYDPILLRYGK